MPAVNGCNFDDAREYSLVALHAALNAAVEHTGVFEPSSALRGCRVGAYTALSHEMGHYAFEAARTHATYKDAVYAMYFAENQATIETRRALMSDASATASARVYPVQNVAAEHDLMPSAPRAHYSVYELNVDRASEYDLVQPNINNMSTRRVGVYAMHSHEITNSLGAAMDNSRCDRHRAGVYATMPASHHHAQMDAHSNTHRNAVYATQEPRTNEFVHVPSPNRNRVDRQVAYSNIADLNMHPTDVYAVSSARSAVYATNMHMYGSHVPVRHSAVSASAKAAVYAANPDIYNIHQRVNSPSTTFKGTVYSANTEIYSTAHTHRNTAVNNTYREAVYATNPEAFAAQERAKSTPAAFRASVYALNAEEEQARNPEEELKNITNTYRYAVYASTEKNRVESQAPMRDPRIAPASGSHKSAVYSMVTQELPMSSTRRLGVRPAPITTTNRMPRSPSSSSLASMQAPMSPLTPRGNRTRTESNASVKASSSVTDLTALVQSGSMIRSTSHMDLQTVANVSLSSLSEEFNFGGATSVPLSPVRLSKRTSVLQRTGHLGNGSVFSRMQKLGY